MRFRKFLKPYKTRGSSFREHTVILGGIFNILKEVLCYYEPNSAPRAGHDIRMSSFFDYGYWICEI